MPATEISLPFSNMGESQRIDVQTTGSISGDVGRQMNHYGRQQQEFTNHPGRRV